MGDIIGLDGTFVWPTQAGLAKGQPCKRWMDVGCCTFIQITIRSKAMEMLQTSAHIAQTVMANCGLYTGNNTGSGQPGQVWLYTGNNARTPR